ncbi:TIGR01621 family pseudouridine synthase [Vogesella urethralis]|uniref:TIGR01621 family pseudouridine synthase n=1 Tax=Vogesella urethralis TaxID=2592656 RepID=UPI00118546AE|nr:TIGR01621 family pseudouridine synthase [Vogesella urethralis]
MSAFQLVYSHPRFHLVHKAPGLGFHREGDTPGLMDLLREALPGDALWPVHRLDRITSGLIVVARSQQDAAELGAAFAGRDVEKYYLALSDAKPARKQGLIKGDMDKGRGGAWKLCKSAANPAVTQFFSHSLAPGLRLFVLRPRTGKTHQLRVAMKSLGAPILGDALYGGSAADRGYLHAYALAFTLAGETHRFVCPPVWGERWPQAALADYLAANPPAGLPWPVL